MDRAVALLASASRPGANAERNLYLSYQSHMASPAKFGRRFLAPPCRKEPTSNVLGYARHQETEAVAMDAPTTPSTLTPAAELAARRARYGSPTKVPNTAPPARPCWPQELELRRHPRTSGRRWPPRPAARRAGDGRLPVEGRGRRLTLHLAGLFRDQADYGRLQLHFGPHRERPCRDVHGPAGAAGCQRRRPWTRRCSLVGGGGCSPLDRLLASQEASAAGEQPGALHRPERELLTRLFRPAAARRRHPGLQRLQTVATTRTIRHFWSAAR